MRPSQARPPLSRPLPGQLLPSSAVPKATNAANAAPTKRQQPAAAPAASPADTHFSVFVRLPFPRNGFIDPAPVDWDASKDRALWKILSRASRSSDLDCSCLAVCPILSNVIANNSTGKGLADNFQVSLPFLLQQAAWLYERELSQVRAQMRRVGGLAPSNMPSPVPGSAPGPAPTGGYAMRRTGSGSTGGAVARVPSALSVRPKESTIPNSVPSTPIKPSAYPMSRTSSANTAIPSRPIVPQSPRQKTDHLRRRSSLNVETIRGTPEPSPNAPLKNPSAAESPSAGTTETSEASSSSGSDSDAPQLVLKSQILRSPRFTVKGKVRADPYADDDDDDDDDSPAFLPFSPPPEESPSTTGSRSQDPGATLRVGLQDPTGNRASFENHRAHEKQPQTEDSSITSSTSSQAVSATGGDASSTNNIRPGMLSPRRTAELTGKSPRKRNTGREGSDGTPSMGSSFSDLDGEPTLHIFGPSSLALAERSLFHSREAPSFESLHSAYPFTLILLIH
ncbi:hypothetical protein GP486_005788 [Trichoglossum hirsutum]|uniref:Autophagy-related protein 29 n=1 Tax=Trichoglossum hirsutum TaxID=265104 RepID=A0A9P8L8L2_9PEZI|nr:hypothetical protein GP486_005788 [Trichoglossum hirsutum]